MAEEGKVIACRDEAEWDALLAKANESRKLIVVDVTASWCGPCRAIAPYFSELAKNHPGVIFLKVDIDVLNTVAAAWMINAMPTFVFVKGGETLHKIVGADKTTLLKKIKELKASVSEMDVRLSSKDYRKNPVLVVMIDLRFVHLESRFSISDKTVARTFGPTIRLGLILGSSLLSGHAPRGGLVCGLMSGSYGCIILWF